MRTQSFLAACVATIAVAVSGSASAAPCAGFTDVDDTIVGVPACQNVEWLKNRQITLGCTSATLYCPNNNVNRLQMAAFMNRLGTALTPVDLTPATAAPAVRTLASNPVICVTGDYAVTGYPRRAYVEAATDVSVPTAAVDVVAVAVYSTNAGATWTPIAQSDHYATLYPGAVPGNHISLTPYGYVDLNVGQSVRFGVGLAQVAGTGNVTAGCNTTVRIANRNSATSPLDPQETSAASAKTRP